MKTMLILLAVLALVVPVWAEPGKQHTQPHGAQPGLTAAPVVACAVTGPNQVTCVWDPLEGALKYAVDAVASYTLSTGGSASVEFDSGTTETSIVLDFPADADGDGVADTLLSAVVKVKGLTVGGGKPAEDAPQRGHVRQNNPFSPTVTCDFASATCS